MWWVQAVTFGEEAWTVRCEEIGSVHCRFCSLICIVMANEGVYVTLRNYTGEDPWISTRKLALERFMNTPARLTLHHPIFLNIIAVFRWKTNLENNTSFCEWSLSLLCMKIFFSDETNPSAWWSKSRKSSLLGAKRSAGCTECLSRFGMHVTVLIVPYFSETVNGSS